MPELATSPSAAPSNAHSLAATTCWLKVLK
jgi:hypothetical protein